MSRSLKSALSKALVVWANENDVPLDATMASVLVTTWGAVPARMEQTILRINDLAILRGQPLTERFICDQISHRFSRSAKLLDCQSIVEMTGRHYNYNSDLLRGRRRFKGLAWARMVCMYLCREEGHSLPHIGRELGGRDHSTVLHGARRIASSILTDLKLRDAVSGLMVQVGAARDSPEPLT